MSRYIVVGDTTEKCRVMEVQISHSKLDEVDQDAYKAWKGIEEVDGSTYDLFTTEVEVRQVFYSTAREVLVHNISRIRAYSNLQVVTSQDFDEYIKENEAKISEWVLWKAHKESLLKEDEIEC